MTYRLGKTPARPAAVHLKLMSYLDSTVLPKIPANVGHDAIVPSWAGALGNQSVGDCVFAGAAHETILFNAEAGRHVPFSDAAVLSDYSALTGYNPNDPSTDQGTDMQQAASYRMKTGIIDATGTRHKIGAYLAVTPGNPDELAAAIYIFGAVGVGLRFPDFAMDEFDQGVPWATKPGQLPNIVGGHYVPATARRNGVFDVVTWGKVQKMTAEFYRHFCDETLVYLSPEFLTAGKSPEHFDLAHLQADLKAFVRA